MTDPMLGRFRRHLGYLAGPVDGSLEEGTLQALIALQKLAAGPGTGRVTPEDLQALRDSNPRQPIRPRKSRKSRLHSHPYVRGKTVREIDPVGTRVLGYENDEIATIRNKWKHGKAELAERNPQT